MIKGAELEKRSRQQTHEAMKGVVRIYGRGFGEGEIRSILDPRFVFPEEWVASGFFIRIEGEEGYILTNSHVVRNATHLEIMSILTSEELFHVEVVGLVPDLEPDIALLKMPEKEVRRYLKIAHLKTLPALKVSFSKSIMRGDEVKAIGYPMGMDEPNISGGEISNFISGSDYSIERLVTDAAINPGNSGGPAITSGGWVIGINTAMIVPAENIGFITPIYLVDNVLQDILEKGEAQIPRLGATLQKNSEANARYLGMKTMEGVIVTEVFKGSLAEKMGLKTRDVILAINARPIDRHGYVLLEKSYRKKNIYDIIHDTLPSDLISLSIFRNGKRLSLKSKATSWAGGEFPSKPIITQRGYIYFAGIIIQEVCEEVISALTVYVAFERVRAYRDYSVQGHNLIVTHVGGGSMGDEAGVELGDMITRINGQRVQSLQEMQRCLMEKRRTESPMLTLDFSSGAFACFDRENLSEEDLKIQYPSEKKFHS